METIQEPSKPLFIWPQFAVVEQGALRSDYRAFAVEVAVKGLKQRTPFAAISNSTLSWKDKLVLNIPESLPQSLRDPSLEFKIYVEKEEEPIAKAFFQFQPLVVNDIGKDPLKRTINFYSLDSQAPAVRLDVLFSYFADPEIMLENKSTRPKTPFTLTVAPRKYLAGEGFEELNQKVYATAVIGTQAFQIEPSEEKVTKANPSATWKEIIPFKMTGEYLLTIRLYKENGDFVGWSVVSLENVWYNMRNLKCRMPLKLDDGTRNAGTVECNFEVIQQVFSSPVHIYPEIELARGTVMLRKLKFANPTSQKRTKEVIVKEGAESVNVKTSVLEIEPNSSADIRLKFVAPAAYKLERVIIDIKDQNTLKIDETLIFNLFSA